MNAYIVVFPWGAAYASDRGNHVELDHGIEPINRRGFETAGQSIRRVYPRAEIYPAHTQDSHCNVDPATNLCQVCGVEHAEPCATCGGRGFHQDDCQEVRK